MNIKWIIWHLTNKCNFSCSFCYTRSGPKENYGLDSNELSTVIEKINNAKSIKVLTIIGGEPLMRKDFDMVLKNIRNDIDIRVDSNGALLLSKWNENFERIKVFNIGIDGVKESNELERKQTEKAIEAINFLISKNKIVNVPFIITKRNKSNITKNLDYITSLKVHKIQINKFSEVLEVDDRNNEINKLSLEDENEVLIQIRDYFVNNPDRLKNVTFAGWKNSYFFDNFVKKEVLNNSCGCGHNRGSISYNGLFLPCPVLANYHTEFLTDNDLINDLSLLGKSIDEISNTELFKLFRNTDGLRPLICQECKYNSKCNSGCKGFNLMLEGNIPGKFVKDCSVH